MDIKDIKIGCIVQVFDYCKQDLEMYKVLNIYVSEDNKIMFKCNKMKFKEKELVTTYSFSSLNFIKCNKMKFNEEKELVTTNVMRFIDGKDVMSIYNKINHE